MRKSAETNDTLISVLEKDFTPGLCLVHRDGSMALFLGFVQQHNSVVEKFPINYGGIRIYRANMILFTANPQRTIFIQSDFIFRDDYYVMGETVKKVFYAK